MAHLALALLGPFQATLDGQPVAALTASRLRALLAYLAVEREREHSRVALASLFWPERPDQDALGALRFALSGLRQFLGDRGAATPFLLVSRHAVAFNSTSDYRLDVTDFGSWVLDALVALDTGFGLRGEQATLPEAPVRGADSKSQTESLKSAIGLYRGEFLEGLAVGDSPAGEEWLLLRREQFHCQALAALRRLAALHELRGEYEMSAAAARRNLSLESWDEAAHRRLMRVMALSGQRSAALAQYQTCRQVLAAELGVEPEDETTHLYVGIRDRTWVPHVRAEGLLIYGHEIAGRKPL